MPSRFTPVHRLSVARAISLVGTEAAYIGLVALVYDRTRSAVWVSAVLVAWLGVEGLVAPLAGSLGDRFDRRRVLIASDVLAAAAFLAMGAGPSVGWLVALAGLAALAESPFPSASAGAIPNLVEPARLVWANSTYAAGQTIGRLAGPLVGGGVVAIAGARWVFVLNGVSFLGSAVMIWSIRGVRFQARREAGGRPSLLGGMRLVLAHPVLRALTVASFLIHLGVGGVLIGELPLVRSFGLGTVAYGVLVAAWAGGNLLGALCARTLAARLELRLLVAAGFGGSSIALAVVALAPWFSAICVLMVLGGLANGLGNVAEDVLIQRSVPDEIRSRVAATAQAVMMTTLGLSLGLSGFVVEALGPRPTYAITAALGLLATAVILRPPGAGARGGEAAPGQAA